MRQLFFVVLATAACSCGGSSNPSSPSPAPASFTGTWALQINVSASCASRLSATWRNPNFLVTGTASAGQITYAQIAATNPAISVLLIAVISGNALTGSMEVVDGILPGDVFSGNGQFNGTLSGTIITGTMNGAFQDQSAFGATCFAADHKVVLTKR